MIAVVDFGSQTAHLITRRIKENKVDSKIFTPQEALIEIKKINPSGIILSGGPASVYEKGAPSVDPSIFALGIPVLGICYGMQLMSKILGGKVVAGKKEFGPATLELRIKNRELRIAEDLPKTFVVWMSHGDRVVSLPKGFEVVGKTAGLPFAFIANSRRRLFAVQFHPEVSHTQKGGQILANFIKICGSSKKNYEVDVDSLKTGIKEIVESSFVIGAVSGGVDSTVSGVLVAEAIGNRFLPVFVDNGLMREGTREHVELIFKKYKTKVIVVDAKAETLKKLKGVSDPEKKRKIIGKLYIDLFEREMEKFVKSGKDVKFLLQGTIYSDVIESKGSKHASNIKSHHNVGGLPRKMKLKLLEPLRYFYKDEVRNIGRKLNLPKSFVERQPFPGPGYAVRIRGEVTQKRLEQERIADTIVLSELDKSKLLDKVFISFPIMSGAFSTAVKGDARLYGEVVAVRIVTSGDVMTADWAKIPYEVLQKISSRIVNEVPDVSRVVYDITTKPPATMEWE
ncbi:MAG: glutamine-hydrolyzing GMP synthase [Candidatus Levyibacteriota bacterium]